MAQDDSDSDSGLPETISFSTSAFVAKGHNHALRSFHAVEKRKIKERNRRHDERLKAQANTWRRVTATTGKGKLYVGNHEVETGDTESGSDLDPHLHRRMTRAMGDAEEETDELNSASASAEEWGGINLASGEDLQAAADQDVEMSRSEGAEEWEEIPRNRDLDSGEGEADDDDDGLGTLRSQAPASKYLPDHVFVAAWSKPKPENEVRQSQTTIKTRGSRKRQPVKPRPKDVVLGWVFQSSHSSIHFLFRPFYESDLFLSTRTVRTLLSSPASAHVQSRGTTLRPPRINNFLANALKLQGKSKSISSRASRWARRPSHLGVMKRTVGAPVTGFARQSQH
ncbi:hypothetical protein DFH94DRAFT_679935 [Russula ochroleuca]|uniref:Uncharacterized protein n=1 Tax=Russula ochroleuca TaxID=152965 RepID=A0A9P5N0S8_9AGAM|nr:hypothetical protein DFH94DRAFT_679935 [Russula ochroleuca]